MFGYFGIFDHSSWLDNAFSDIPDGIKQLLHVLTAVNMRNKHIYYLVISLCFFLFFLSKNDQVWGANLGGKRHNFSFFTYWRPSKRATTVKCHLEYQNIHYQVNLSDQLCQNSQTWSKSKISFFGQKMTKSGGVT